MVISPKTIEKLRNLIFEGEISEVRLKELLN